MRIGVLGTGMVGQALAGKCDALGHEVMMGSRSAESEGVRAWLATAGGQARGGSFAEAAAFGELVFDCLNGDVAYDTFAAIDDAALAGKIVVDVANPLTAVPTDPYPTLKYGVESSLGEKIQARFPNARVVKALNTLNCYVMIDPSRVGDPQTLFICGDDAGAKGEVIRFLCENFGWRADQFIDVGDIVSARATELLMPLWMRLWSAAGHTDFNWSITNFRR